MNVDEEEGMSNEEQLRHLLLLFIVLFQAKHLSVKAGEDLLAFLSGQLGVQATMDKSLDLELNRS